MTQWQLLKGRAPMTDADLAALTRRLAGTAIDYKELYEAAVAERDEARLAFANLHREYMKLKGQTNE